ncbi:MAG TPA: hypothetical protein VFX84_01525, partial [Candidatus Saccharimonadales bacterium]|nr:hypothetical protein [Candidatus Saccharimonadales bacterium]
MSELAPQQPAPGEQDGGQESPAMALSDAIKARLESAVQAGEHKSDNVDGNPYLNLQAEGDPDQAPGDIYRVLEARPMGRSESDTAVVVVDHVEGVQPTLNVGDLQIGDEQR